MITKTELMNPQAAEENGQQSSDDFAFRVLWRGNDFGADERSRVGFRMNRNGRAPVEVKIHAHSTRGRAGFLPVLSGEPVTAAVVPRKTPELVCTAESNIVPFMFYASVSISTTQCVKRPLWRS